MLCLLHFGDQLQVVWEINLLVQIHVKDLVILRGDCHVCVLKLLFIFAFADREGGDMGAFELGGSPLEEANILTFTFLIRAFFVSLVLEKVKDIIRCSNETKPIGNYMLEI